MAASSLLALIDDLATILDDLAVLTKVAAKKTAGVLGDDLALNAQQVSGIAAERELPVVWAVTKGSFRNKAILVPAALAVSALAPWAVLPLLMAGGAYLCFEGFEKLAHKLLHRQDGERAHEAELARSLADPAADLVAVEQEKIKGAVRTDFILSAEIITIALGTVADSPLATRVVVLTGTAIVMTIGVYGLVAGIVKLDDAGLYLSRRQSGVARQLGAALLGAAPRLMKALSVAGTIAMFLVGGGIIVHGIPAAHHAAEGLARLAGALPGIGGALAWLAAPLLNGLAGVLAGGLVLAAVTLAKRTFRRAAPAPHA